MIFDAEASYAERIGHERLRRFISAAASLFYGLGLQEQTDPALGEAARRSIGVLRLIAHRVEEELRETTRARGHDVLQLSHARLIALIGHEGAGVSEMARRQGVSRQATSATVRSLESLGYARRETDQDDGRAVHVVLTERGETLIRDSLLALEELEKHFREILGARRFADLVNVAGALHAALHPEDDVVSAVLPSAEAPTAGPREGDAPDDRELREIAARLEQRLGKQAAARLGTLLSPGIPD
jgi:DNA-binding MarR family transcriptional regulator